MEPGERRVLEKCFFEAEEELKEALATINQAKAQMIDVGMQLGMDRREND